MKNGKGNHRFEQAALLGVGIAIVALIIGLTVVYIVSHPI
jgi:hypothetical protein